MPPKKTAFKENLAKGRDVKAVKQSTLESETVTEDLWNDLQKANLQIQSLELELSQKASECEKLCSELDKLRKKLEKYEADTSHWKIKHKDTYHELRMQRQTTKRGQVKQAKLEQQIHILEEANTNALAQLLRGSQISITVLRKIAVRSKDVKKRAIAAVKAKISQQRSVYHLANKGVFTEETRNIVRLLVKAGCSRNYVNEVICAILKSTGITAIGSISRSSIARILQEGYYASHIQLGYEMRNTEGMTFSADGTSHRSINYNSRHVHLLVEDYARPGDNNKQRATRTFGIQSSRDGSSEEAVADWEITLKKIVEIYNDSPLGKRSCGLLSFVNLLIKLMGMNTDHCSKEKKDARMLEELKAWAVDQHLGEEKMLDMSVADTAKYFRVAEEKMIKKVGGQQKWAALPDFKQAEKKAAMVEEAVAELGREAFEGLSDEEKRILRLFIWAGCGAHKDLNTVRGGYLAMLRWWEDNEGIDVERPVLLANRDNDPVVRERNTTIKQGDIPTPAQERAFHKSTRGAIKTAEIAGAIFNHKDDKKGHHDTFRYWWWEHIGIPFTFPDTSNNRFQSYCDAAAALILYKEEFLDFLESLRVNKQNSTLNHMEANLWKALNCTSTMTELAVLAIYAEAISYPYMKAVRDTSAGPKNMLDLGPLHSHVYNHIHKIIDNPDILLGKDSSHLTGSLHGEEWQNPEVVQHILDLIPTFPHFHDLFIAFFTGAAETWERFTSEFAPGGLIDEATTEEKELAWMPATNDENEGALGSFRKLMRHQPQLTLLSYNAIAMFFRNNTQAFMAAKFIKEDYTHLHKLGHLTKGIDSEEMRRKGHVDFWDNRQVEKMARKEVREQNAKDKAERLASLHLVLDEKKLPALKSQNLQDQYALFKARGAPNLQNIKKPSKVGEIRQALSDAINMHLKGTWIIVDEEESDSEGSNSVDENENEDDWEDE
ncbi:hypothetical protein BDN70DRAFT_811358 [Pholiota conissans]|uniref:Uncharacterized protein n=1 Tax=Pholiota conissans TaxID=109636 RepID=A0A9P5YZM6_9AGAR|nr:hypothetical protein BDN70DRAFT_811358 [Pholiota conissans]